MYAVIGLGNPGQRYRDTRHNMGFWTIAALQKKLGVKESDWKEKGGALYARADFRGEDLLLVLPQQFMNRSGEAVRPLLSFFKIAPSETIVAYDELDFDVGTLRLKRGGSGGGHNGIGDLIRHLDSPDFHRIRIGIGHPRRALPESAMDPSDWVLSVPRSEEAKTLLEVCERAADAACMLIEKGLEAAQQKFHT